MIVAAWKLTRPMLPATSIDEALWALNSAHKVALFEDNSKRYEETYISSGGNF
jgi:hypothetical protein